MAHGRQIEEAGAEAVIDSAHQDDQGDEPPQIEPEAEAGSALADDQPTESKPDGGADRPAPAEAPPAGLARIRTAAANATSRLLGVTRAIGGAPAPSNVDAATAHDGDMAETDRANPDAGAQP